MDKYSRSCLIFSFSLDQRHPSILKKSWCPCPNHAVVVSDFMKLYSSELMLRSPFSHRASKGLAKQSITVFWSWSQSPFCPVSFISCRIILLLSPFERTRKFMDEKKRRGNFSGLYPSGPYKNITGHNVQSRPWSAEQRGNLTSHNFGKQIFGTKPVVRATSTCWKSCRSQQACSAQGELGIAAWTVKINQIYP